MAITPADFTPEQSTAFKEAVNEYKETNKKYIDLIKQHDNEIALKVMEAEEKAERDLLKSFDVYFDE